MSRRITPTYILLNQITLAAASASVTFSNIPQNYGDLVLVADHPNTASLNEMILLINGDTGANYSRVFMEGRASVGTAAQTQNKAYVGAYGTARATLVCHIMDYSATGAHTTMIARGDSVDGTKATAVRWANTDAITSIQVAMDSINLPTNTSISLYGIAA